jgi:hypothetical protein
MCDPPTVCSAIQASLCNSVIWCGMNGGGGGGWLLCAKYLLSKYKDEVTAENLIDGEKHLLETLLVSSQ